MDAAAGGLAGVEPTVVTTILKPDWLHRQITKCRQSTGVSMAYHPGSMTTIMRTLRKGGSVAFMNDQYSNPPAGLPVMFFGAKVNTLGAVGPLANRTGAAIVPVSTWRDQTGFSHVVVEPELELGSDLADAEKATTAIAAHVEGWVRAHPEQWLWIHRRFKHAVWGHLT
jgi:lauroyl/myristoyl acyltransferase